MTDTKKGRTPGRPRNFDADQAVAKAQGMFHARGYDAVSVADLTAALGIKPPSFYAAFGSKAGLYSRVLERYSESGAIPFAALLRADRPVAVCLAEVLEEAARRYGASADAPGCLVVEGTRSNDPDAQAAACVHHDAAEALIHDYIAARFPEGADRITDFMDTVMAGLSAMARRGHGTERLMASAKMAGRALMREFSEDHA
ncbi:TetR/AcrR family transcriptional regulator [Alloyangia pacifica]|nr:TetR/AcrR family transcriptional regulator [Alloyangia pacifica]